LWGGFASIVFVPLIQFLLVVEIAPVEHRKADEQQRTDDTEDQLVTVRAADGAVTRLLVISTSTTNASEQE
jgi:hypothetical protein